MPRGDHTGPGGFGPKTGRAAGFCAGYGMPGSTNPMPGRGFGMGWGRGGGLGRGWRHRNWFCATGAPGWARFGYGAPWGGVPFAPYGVPPTAEQEAEFLKAQAESLKEQLESISKRLDELEKAE